MNAITPPATVNKPEAIPFFPFSAEQVDLRIAHIKATYRTPTDIDLTDVKDLEKLRSIAYQIAKAKADFEREVESSLKEAKKNIKTVEDQKKRFINEIEVYQRSVRRPLTEYENRRGALDNRIREMEKVSETYPSDDSRKIEEKIKRLGDLYNHDWQEFKHQADYVYPAFLKALNDKLSERKKYEEELAELERIRRQEKARLQQAQNAAQSTVNVASVPTAAKQDEYPQERRPETQNADARRRQLCLEALADMEEAGVDRKQAIALIQAIRDGKIRNIILKL